MSPHRDHDDDSPNEALVAALEAHARGLGGPADVHSALAASRLLIPVVEHESGGVSHLTSVTVTDVDGEPVMLAFTSESALRSWDSHARPVPVPTRSAAEAALANGATSVVIDIAGPVSFAVDAPGLRSLASGWRDHGTWPAAGHASSADEDDTSVETPVATSEPVDTGTNPVGAVRNLVAQRLMPTTIAVATRVWGAVQRVSRIGSR